MSSMSAIFRKILSDTDYCSFCYQNISEKDNSYELQDKVIFYEISETIYNILIAVLGAQMLETLSPKLICHKCTKTIINAYKFIVMCKNNVSKLSHTTDCVLKHMEHSLKKDILRNKSLFLVVNKDNYNLNILYDKRKYYQREDSLNRFRVLQKKEDEENVHCSQNIYFEHESGIKSIQIKSVRKKPAKAFQISDVLHKKDDQDNFKCKHCLKPYPSVLKLKQHYFRVHAPKDFKCSKCPRSFGSPLLLRRHSKDSHCTVVCSQCGKMYNNIYSLRHHEKNHKQCLKCQTCDKVYKGKQSFKNHIAQNLCQKLRKSNAEAKFTCDYCEKKYSQKTALSVHIRLEHENGKALICDWCGKKLSSISRLKDHMLKHTKQKNFGCNICGGKFVTKVSLLYHTRTHTGEKPYKCAQCDMRFLSASRRCEHVKRHHSGADLECDICHGKFKGQTSLMRHRRRHFNVSSRLYYNLPQ